MRCYENQLLIKLCQRPSYAALLCHACRKNYLLHSTMNYMRVYAAAKRRSRARHDILDLLHNGRQRRPKKQKQKVIPPKKFGIFARALSFKILLNDTAASEIDPAPKNVVIIPIDVASANKTKQTKEKRKSSTRSKNRKSTFHVDDQPSEDGYSLRNLRMHGDLHHGNDLSNENDEYGESFLQNIISAEHHQETNEQFFQEEQGAEPFKSAGPIFSEDQPRESPSTKQFESAHTMISFDSSMVSALTTAQLNKYAVDISNDFNDGSHPFDASQGESTTIIPVAPNKFSSNDSQHISYTSTSAEWQFKTPTQASYSQVSIGSSSTGTEFSQFNQADDSDWTLSFSKSSFDYSMVNRPQLTMGMVMESKRLGSRRAFDQLFGNNNKSSSLNKNDLEKSLFTPPQLLLQSQSIGAPCTLQFLRDNSFDFQSNTSDFHHSNVKSETHSDTSCVSLFTKDSLFDDSSIFAEFYNLQRIK